MTKNEVREMYGLPPIEEEVKPIVSSAIHRFDDTCEHAFTSESEVDEIIDVFILFGDDVTNYEIVEEDINKEFSFAFPYSLQLFYRTSLGKSTPILVFPRKPCRINNLEP